MVLLVPVRRVLGRRRGVVSLPMTVMEHLARRAGAGAGVGEGVVRVARGRALGGHSKVERSERESEQRTREERRGRSRAERARGLPLTSQRKTGLEEGSLGVRGQVLIARNPLRRVSEGREGSWRRGSEATRGRAEWSAERRTTDRPCVRAREREGDTQPGGKTLPNQKRRGEEEETEQKRSKSSTSRRVRPNSRSTQESRTPLRPQPLAAPSDLQPTPSPSNSLSLLQTCPSSPPASWPSVPSHSSGLPPLSLRSID